MSIDRRRKKSSHDGMLFNCECNIELLTSEITGGFDQIKGSVHLKTTDTVNFKKIWVQLEGHSTANFSSRSNDGRITKHMKTYRFMPQQDELLSLSLLENSPSCLIIGNADPRITTTTILERGTYIFPFEIKLNGQRRPAAFQSPFGTLYYKISLHVISLIALYSTHTFCSEKIADEKFIKTHGYLKLDPSLDEPIQYVYTKYRSFFSKKQPIKLDVVLDKLGYLPSEKIFCQITVHNLTSERLTEITVVLVQKLSYHTDDLSGNKVVMTVLDEQGHVGNSSGCGVRWDLSIPIPPKCMPTYANSKKCIEINYYLQVKVQGKSSISGETEITIGTTRTGENLITNNILNVNPYGSVYAGSNWDLSSNPTRTRTSSPSSQLPPSYSVLSSRRASVETMAPPAYDTVFKKVEDPIISGLAQISL